MATHITLKFELVEYEGDGDDEKRVRHITFENYGAFTHAEWHQTTGRFHNSRGSLLPHEFAGMQKVIEGIREMQGTSQEPPQ